MGREGVPQHATGRGNEICQLLLRQYLARALQAMACQQGLPPWHVPWREGRIGKWNNLETVDFSGFMEHLAKSGQPSLEQ